MEKPHRPLRISGLFIILAFFFFCNSGRAQSTTKYDEVSVFLNVQRIGGTEIPALISDQTIYLPVADIFDFLHVKNTLSAKMDSISGSMINPQAKFIIDKTRILYLDKVYQLQPGDLVRTTTNLYLRSDYFGKVFGLECSFNFRSLSVVLSTEIELPIMIEMRQAQMRTNANQLRGTAKADTIVNRTYPLFHFGTADYAVVTSTGNQRGPSDVRLNLGLGGVIAGGETNIIFNYHNLEPLSWRQQYYLWRLVNNDNTVVKQISAGKIQGQSIASIYAPVVGIQVTNTPTAYRRSFGTYTLSNHTEPNWTVELYVNGVLINYVKADAAGFYTFNVPLTYGNSLVKLRFYGPYGEERVSEQNIAIPFNFLPKGEFEYTASAGIVEDSLHSRFSRFSGNYGLNKNISIGGGTEYLSSIGSGTTIPFINTSVRVLPNLLFSAEYDHNVRSKALLSYNLSSGLQIELNYTWYKKEQTAINNTFLEDRKVTVSFPIRGSKISAYTRILLEQFILPNTKYTNVEWLVSSSFGSYSTSINTYALFMDQNNPYVYSLFSISMRALKSILVTQQLQYEYGAGKIIGIKTELEKRVFRNGYLNVSYEQNFSSNIRNMELGIRYDFSFAQTRATLRKSNEVLTYLQSANGSLIHDSKSNYTSFNNHTSVGRGAVILAPYLDMNGNGRRDADEPKVLGLRIHVNGGRVEQSVKDSTIRITDLEAYTNYVIELDSTSFDIVAWHLHRKNYSVIIDPNSVKRIEVPVLVLGQVSGQVIFKNKEEEKGIGRILINLYNDKAKLVAHTVSEADGYFTYMGLMPGNYSASIDAAQLNKLELVSSPLALPFSIIRNMEGALVEGLTFVIKPKPENSVPPIKN
ncbi:hypothetical protein [Pedobacter sp. UYP1]|uniref:hypothetical protein n=1 Tax=Pedobacter sp. UYP1 TaxID=1756396 RepID=UPI003397098F